MSNHPQGAKRTRPYVAWPSAGPGPGERRRKSGERAGLRGYLGPRAVAWGRRERAAGERADQRRVPPVDSGATAASVERHPTPARGVLVSAASADVIRWGRERVRTGPWRGQDEVALLNPMPSAPLPSAEFLRRCLETLASRGYRRVVTGALSPVEQAGFLAAGFDVEERLHLLGINLAHDLPPIPAGYPLRRVRRPRRPDVLAVDRAAFSPFWQFDEASLSDALHATPTVRFRAAFVAGDRVAGYAICGRSGAHGFVQRLAVEPTRQRAGTGRRLLLDGLDWMRRRGVARAVVNTQVGNSAALSLYRQVGFEEEPIGLTVLSAGLP